MSAGLIYAPAVDELFWAEKGGGAFVNERRLRVSARRDLKDAVFATGIPFAAVAPQRRLAFARTLGALMPQVAGIRRFGAAALDLAWVAAGRYDGFWELGLKRWDMAAGMLLVREAGGFATDPAGEDPRDTGEVIAANPHLHAALSEAVIEALYAANPEHEEHDGFNHWLVASVSPVICRACDLAVFCSRSAALRGHARDGADHRGSARARCAQAPSLPPEHPAAKAKPRSAAGRTAAAKSGRHAPGR